MWGLQESFVAHSCLLINSISSACFHWLPPSSIWEVGREMSLLHASQPIRLHPPTGIYTMNLELNHIAGFGLHYKILQIWMMCELYLWSSMTYRGCIPTWNVCISVWLTVMLINHYATMQTHQVGFWFMKIWPSKMWAKPPHSVVDKACGHLVVCYIEFVND